MLDKFIFNGEYIQPLKCQTKIAADDILSFYYLLSKKIRLVLGRTYRGLTGGFLLLQNFSVAISVSPHVFISLVLILISMFLR